MAIKIREHNSRFAFSRKRQYSYLFGQILAMKFVEIKTMIYFILVFILENALKQ